MCVHFIAGAVIVMPTSDFHSSTRGAKGREKNGKEIETSIDALYSFHQTFFFLF